MVLMRFGVRAVCLNELMEKNKALNIKWINVNRSAMKKTLDEIKFGKLGVKVVKCYSLDLFVMAKFTGYKEILLNFT